MILYFLALNFLALITMVKLSCQIHAGKLPELTVHQIPQMEKRIVIRLVVFPTRYKMCCYYLPTPPFRDKSS